MPSVRAAHAPHFPPLRHTVTNERGSVCTSAKIQNRGKNLANGKHFSAVVIKREAHLSARSATASHTFEICSSLVSMLFLVFSFFSDFPIFFPANPPARKHSSSTRSGAVGHDEYMAVSRLGEHALQAVGLVTEIASR